MTPEPSMPTVSDGAERPSPGGGVAGVVVPKSAPSIFTSASTLLLLLALLMSGVAKRVVVRIDAVSDIV